MAIVNEKFVFLFIVEFFIPRGGDYLCSLLNSYFLRQSEAISRSAFIRMKANPFEIFIPICYSVRGRFYR